jgi:AraC-like DNA-binding protein
VQAGYMSYDETNPTLLRFSTSDLPQRDRLPFWREIFARKIVHVDIEPAADFSLQAAASLLEWPGLRAIWATSSPARMVRKVPMLADGDDSLGLIIKRRGQMVMAQRRVELALGKREALAVLHAEPAMLELSEADWVALCVPRAALAPFVTDIERKTMTLISQDSEPLRLLTKYLEILKGEPELIKPELRHSVVTHIHDLVAMTLGTTRDGAVVVSKRGLRAARLRAIITDILENLTQLELTVTTVALRQGITPRYVHLVFEGQGTTFSEFVLNARLVHAHRMLTNPCLAGLTITNIAFASGFGDLSYFDRAFRRRFGETPSDVRQGLCEDRQKNQERSPQIALQENAKPPT